MRRTKKAIPELAASPDLQVPPPEVRTGPDRIPCGTTAAVAFAALRKQELELANGIAACAAEVLRNGGAQPTDNYEAERDANGVIVAFRRKVAP